MAANVAISNVNDVVDSDMETGSSTLDEDKQSRQLAVYGRESMKKLGNAKVLISGLNGLGVEIAKNVILANVKKVVLHDTKSVAFSDLSSQFYLSEADVGQNRATACLKKMQGLNPDVRIKAASGELSNLAALKKFTIVVLVDAPLSQAVAVDAFCRAQNPPIYFIRADVNGLFGRVFVDLNNFVVQDPTGEPARSAIIERITKGNPGEVHCVFEDEGRHDLQDGDRVIFTEVKGMTELNSQTREVKVMNPYAFSIGDTSNLNEHTKGGIVIQVKPEVRLRCRSLADCQDRPIFYGDVAKADAPALPADTWVVDSRQDTSWLESDFAKFGRPAELHVAFRALDTFREKHGSLPQVNNQAQAAELIALAREINAALPENQRAEPSDALLTKLAYGATAVLNPMAAIFGGVVGQEVVKACTGKFHPIFQFFYLDSLECLPANWPLAAEEYAPTNTRYDANIQVFGKSFQEKIQKLRYFLVGAGALGCEFIKNFAMMGVGCDPAGQVIITDDDRIEASNLSRQFLFRNDNIRQSKSACAAAAARVMNPQLNVHDIQERVGTNTEEIFNEAFWKGLSGVCNALDNVPARLYVDERCVFFGKSLLESGTLGPKCNVQVVLPHMTENYGASVDPPEKEAPQCTIHNFPHNIDHCLIWARSEFEGQFCNYPREAQKFITTDGQYVESMKSAGSRGMDILQNLRGDDTWGGGIREVLVTGHCANFHDCVVWARNKFEQYGANVVKQLLFSFPADSVNKKTGKPFWNPPKRIPTPLRFDHNDPLHIGFIVAAANLRAKISGIPVPAEHRDRAYIANIVKDVAVAPYEPRSGVKIQEDKDDVPAEPNADASEGEINAVIASLPSVAELKARGAQYLPESFEKDDDTNFHIDFVMALGNIRARAYEIAEVDFLQAKLRAGRIIPAIATATAMVTGLVCLELWKREQGLPVESFRNSFNNLAIPIFAQSEPVPPKKIKSRTDKIRPDPLNHPDYVEEEEVRAVPDPHTVWDQIEVTGDLTVRQFIEYFKEKYQLSTGMITISSALVYRKIKEHEDRLDTSLVTLYEKMKQTSIRDKKYILVEPHFSDDEMRTIDYPRILLRFAA